MKRYKADNIFNLKEDKDGAFVLYSDMTEVLIKFLDIAVESGADADKLKEMLND